MSRTFIRRVALLSCLMAPGGLIAGIEFPQQPGETVVPNRLIIRFKTGANPSSILAPYLQNAVIKSLALKNVYVINSPNALVSGIATLLSKLSLVDFVEPDRVRQTNVSTPNDPDYSASLQWGLFTIQAQQAWNQLGVPFLTSATAGGNRVKVAIIDTGADCTHPDFKNTGAGSTDSALGGQILWNSSQAVVPTSLASPACAWQDDNGHGTHVSGIVAAATSNGAGVASLGYPLQLVEYKVLDASGSGSDSSVASAIVAAANAGVQVISMSLGGAGYSQTMQSAIDYAWQHNVVVVAAAGNSASSSLFFPAGADHTVGVSASDSNNNLASFSNFGNYVALAAPGVSILSTVPSYSVTLGCCNYGYLSGTSMATPFVSALAGLMAMTTPNTSAAAIIQRMEQTAVSSTGGGAWSQSFGYGIINANSAVAGTNRATTSGGVTGQVTDPAGNPISGAVVTVGGQSTPATDSTGLYWLRPVAAGTYPVTVTAPGAPTQNLTVTVAAGADTLFPVTLGITYANFTGSVTDQGLPVANAIVQALSGGAIAGTAVADVNGQYTLWVPGGSGYTVQASQVERATTGVSSLSVAPGGSTVVNLTLPSLQGTISGVVQGTLSNPLAGAQVTVNSTLPLSAITASNGSYAISGISSGTYSVTASAGGFTSSTVNGVAVSPNVITPLNFQLVRLPLSTPVFNPPAGTYASTQTVTIASAPGATIRYTVDGSLPSETAGTIYTGPVLVNSSETLNAIAYAPGVSDSAIGTASYVLSNSWYGAWSYRKQITLNHTQVSGAANLNSFPVLVSIADVNLQTAAKVDGSDILFTAADGMTKLNHEIEQYSSSNGQLAAWVSVPALSPAADTIIYMYYGNPTAGSQQNAAAVWDSNYKGVFHLSNSSGISTSDSTQYANNATNSGVTAAAGKTAGGGSFNGSAYLLLAGIPLSNTNTISAWFYDTATAGSSRALWGNSTGYTNEVDYNAYTGYNQIGLKKTGIGYNSTNSYSPNAWHQVVVTNSGGTAKLYVDGVADSLTVSGMPGYLLNYLGRGQNGYWGGSLDEIHVSDGIARSSDWVLTEFRNQNAPGTFVTLGAQQSADSGGPVTITVASAPAGLSLTVDSAACTSPCTFQWTPGAIHTIAAANQAGATGVQYLWSNWSDAGAASHAITVPGTAATYTANFTTQYFLTTAANPAASGSINPASGWYNAGAVVAVSAAANTGYQFSGFTGGLTGTTTPQNVTMTAPVSVTANFGASPVTITVASAPAGLSLTVDSAPCTSPCTFQWTPGAIHTVAAANQAGATGVQYLWANWSDAGAASHTITVPATAATYTANFTTQYFLTTAASPTAGGGINPASGWYNAGAMVAVSATANTGYQFTGFTGELTGTTTPQNVTMAAPVSVTANFSSSQTNWYGAWSYRKQITLNHTQVSGAANLNGFPVLVSIADANLQSAAKADGSDILFTAADGMTKLNHEIEQYSSSNGQLAVWVSVPALSPAADTIIYMYYGNPAAGSQQNAAAVWDSNYKGVFHLSNSSGISTSDSTQYANNATNSGVTAAAGKMGGAGSFNGSAYLLLAGIPLSNTNTISAWFYDTATAGSTHALWGNSTGYTNEADYNAYTGYNQIGLKKTGIGYNSTNAYSPNAWHQVVVTNSGGTAKLYVDGVADGLTVSGMPGYLLNYLGHSQNGYWGGLLDEIRVSDGIARSSDWVLTEYRNQNAPGTFVTLGAQQSAGSGGPVTITVASAPAGLSLTVDSAACSSPCTFQWTPGAIHTIAAANQAGATGVQYLWSNWSDAGAASHTITVPGTAATYTANFTTQYFLTTAASPLAGGSINPASGWYNAGAVVAVSAAANTGYQFSGFTGGLTGTTTPQNVTMTAPVSVTANFGASPVTITVASAPAGLSLTVDSAACSSPCTFQWTPGTIHTISAANQAGATGVQYLWSNWSDAGTASHTITVPGTAATYTANFTTQYFLTTAASPTAGGVINPASGWYNAGAVVAVSATANTGYQFTGFTGGLAGTTTPQNVTMTAPVSVTANFSSTSQTNWYGVWSYRKQLTLNHTQVSGAANLNSFPVLVSIADANLQSAAKADGSDILFTAADGMTKLNHEIEQYTSGTGQLAAWVNVPALSPAADTIIYMYYGNPAASNQQNPAGVWDSNYKGVFHLGNNSGIATSDSTQYANNATNSGVTAATGKMGGAGSFNGSAYLLLAGIPLSNTNTISAWFYDTATAGSSHALWGNSTGYTNEVDYNAYPKYNQITLEKTGIGYNSATAYSPNAWHQVVVTNSGGTARLYVDGVADGLTVSGMPGYLLNYLGHSQYGYWGGSLDEIRVSDGIARSSDWVLTEYRNQNAPGTFLSVGTQQNQ